MPIEIDGPPTLFTREEQEEHEVRHWASEWSFWKGGRLKGLKGFEVQGLGV